MKSRSFKLWLGLLTRKYRKFLRVHPVIASNKQCCGNYRHIYHIHRNYRALLKTKQEMLTTNTSGVHQDNDFGFDSEIDIENYLNFEIYPESSGSDSEDLRNFLYPKSNDAILSDLTSCASVQQVFDIMQNNAGNLKSEHASQAVLVLWDLQKLFLKLNKPIYDYQTCSFSNQFPDITVKKYNEDVVTHREFQNLLELISQTYLYMTPDAAACTLLYLNKMGISMNELVMQHLVTFCEDKIVNLGIDFPLTALSRLTVALNSDGGLRAMYSLQRILPTILNALDVCDNASDFSLVTICLHNTHILLLNDNLNTYKLKVQDLISRNVITNVDKKTILKAAMFLSYPYWSHQNSDSIKNLLNLLKGNVKNMEPRLLFTLHKVLLSQLEPADLIREVQNYAVSLLPITSQVFENEFSLIDMCNLLSCAVIYSSSYKNKEAENFVKSHLINSNASINTSFLTLRYLKISDFDLCEAFWTKTLNAIVNNSGTRQQLYKLLRVAHRYMYFNNNLGGTYRHRRFEREMISLLMKEAENSISGMIPSKFARIACFVIAYGNDHVKKLGGNTFIKDVIQKLIEMGPQFSVIDCVHISRGFNIAWSLHFAKHTRYNFIETDYVLLDSAMNSCASRHLADCNSIADLNMITKSYLNRKNTKDSELFKEIVKRYDCARDELSSRLIRGAIYNFQSSYCLVPSALDHMVNYVVDNSTEILTDTAVKLLNLCYLLAYIPTKAEAFLKVSQQLITRDQDSVSGLTLIQSCLAFCFFQCLPESLIHSVFTVDFLEKIDEEISDCYAKAAYPFKVRQSMMELNRAVCIDYPETDTPWFHEKFCESIKTADSGRLSSFHQDVLHYLSVVLGGKDYVQVNTYSPYYYKIDNLVLLDNEKKPVKQKQETGIDVSKLALLLYDDTVYTKNVSHLTGKFVMKHRHLEMLGYTVIPINYEQWNSMYMSEPKAKVDFIQKSLWSNDDQLVFREKC